MSAISYADAEGYWIAAGGPKALAPVMAAVAMAESSLNPAAIQAGQPYPTTGWGLWQITPGDSEPQFGVDQALLNPAANAAAAVAKYKAQGLGAWTTYTSGAYQQFMQGGTAPTADLTSATTPGTGGAQDSGSGLDLTGFLHTIGALLHDIAVPLDWLLSAFAPGQGWRITMGAGAAVATVGGVKAWHAAATSAGPSASLPLAVLLFGAATMGAYMALRPWPQAGGKPEKPGAYAVEILQGKPPAEGPARPSHVSEIEAGLAAFAGMWALGKVAGALQGSGGILGKIGGLLGGVVGWAGKLLGKVLGKIKTVPEAP